MARLVDNLITQLELVAKEYSRQWQIFRHQKYELERGWLMESTLATTELESIPRKLRNQGYYTPRIEWYYENLRLTTSWSDDSKLTFKVDIPAAGLTEYLNYIYLLYFPVLAKDNFVCNVNGMNSVAVNTESGSMISSLTCIGDEPELRMPSKEFVVPSCEFGLITNGDVRGCPIEIFQKTGSSDVILVDIDVFIVSPYAELSVIKCCRGQEPLTQVISKPTRISIVRDCTLTTSEWCVSGISRGHDTLNHGSKVLTFNHTLNFTWPKQFTLEPMKAFTYNRRVEIPLADLQQFDDDYLEPIGFDNRDKLMYVLMSVFAIALCIGVGIIVYRSYFLVSWRRKQCRPVTTKNEELTLETLAMSLE